MVRTLGIPGPRSGDDSPAGGGLGLRAWIPSWPAEGATSDWATGDRGPQAGRLGPAVLGLAVGDRGPRADSWGPRFCRRGSYLRLTGQDRVSAGEGATSDWAVGDRGRGSYLRLGEWGPRQVRRRGGSWRGPRGGIRAPSPHEGGQNILRYPRPDPVEGRPPLVGRPGAPPKTKSVHRAPNRLRLR